MNSKLLSISLAIFMAGFSSVSALIEWPIVDTRMNKVGLTDENCKYNLEGSIICKDTDGKETVIDNVKVITGSSTGTPPWLEYSNYIGQTSGTVGYTEGTSGAPGSGRRTIYLKE